MSWLFSQALVEEYLGDICLDGEQSAPLNGSLIPQAYCAPDKMTKFSRLSRFGMTYKPLTESRGEELLTLYLADFHARTLAQPAKAQELKETNPQCGNTWQGSLARLDPSTSLWRTAQCSLLEDLELFLQTFPRWGSMQSGALYQLPILVQTISVKEFGSEPNNETFFHTPNTTGLDGGSNGRKALKKRLIWPTPISSKAGAWRGDGQISMVAKNVTTYKEYLMLTQGACKSKLNKYWPTPMSTEHKANRQTRENHQNGLTQAVLAEEIKKWPTPTANMHKGSGPTLIRSDGKDRSWDSLHYAVEQVTDIGGQLNPNWVEWLMNWPITWSNLNAIDSKEYQRWKETSTKTFQKSNQLSEMWWDNDPSQASFGQQPNKQSEQQHCNAVPQMPRDTTRQREMEGSYEGSNLPLLCNDIYLSESEAENVQSGMREQISVDETKIVPRTDKNIVARVDRLKAIGNGQVPLCAATAWELLK